jgi:hypothetical protein
MVIKEECPKSANLPAFSPARTDTACWIQQDSGEKILMECIDEIVFPFFGLANTDHLISPDGELLTWVGFFGREV